MYDFFHTQFLGEPLANYCWFFGIVLATLLLKKPFATLLTGIGNKITERFSHARQAHDIHSGFGKPLERLIQIILFFIAFEQLSALLDKLVIHHKIGTIGKINISIGDVLDDIFLFLFIVTLAHFVSLIIDFAYRLRMDKASHEVDRARLQLLPLVKEMAKLVLWILSTFWILGSVFHVNVPALITGLGIGGVAIALAGKTTVENLFAAFTILTDKPFHIGEKIKLGEIEGTVERIGFRSTRVRGEDGSAYIIPNQNIVVGNLINLSQRETVGQKLVINIRYGVSHNDLQQLIEELKKTLKETTPVIAPADVTLEAFGVKAFQLLVNYHLPEPLPTGQTLAELKQKINLATYEVVTRYTAKGAVTVSE